MTSPIDLDLPLNPWVPMRDPIDLAVLGKLQEELGEAVAAVARCLIQGIDESEPTTGRVNREWLESELGDVMGNVVMVAERFNLDGDRIADRALEKQNHLRRWHNLLRSLP